MGRSKIRALLVSSITVMLCVALLVCGTYALWSKQTTLETHLVAGKLDLKLERTKLTKTVLDTDGYLAETTDNTVIDLTSASDANVFGITDGELIVPASSYEAELKITNTGDVAFKYDIVIKLGTEIDEHLKEQLKVSVDNGEGKALSEFDEANGEVVVSKSVVKSGNSTFAIKIEFEDLDTNNDAMEERADFDLVVKAVQLTEAQ